MWNINISKAKLNAQLEASSHAKIGSILGLAGRGDADDYTPPSGGAMGINRPTRVKLATQNIPRAEAADFIKKYAVAVLDQFADQPIIPAWSEEVIKDFRKNGWALEREEIESNAPWSSKMDYKWNVSPLGHEETPLKDLTTKLVDLFNASNLEVAAGHYSQACKNFEAKDWAAANAQLRTALESTLIELTKKQRQWNGSKGGDAINVLAAWNLLTENESKYFTGLWSMSHVNGSHPGLSDEVESQFRMYSVTAGLYYLANLLS